MNVDITAKNDARMNMTNVAWRFVLEFGCRCGWNPIGTSKPIWFKESQPWDESYDPAMGQEISSIDADEIGEAVARGLSSAQLQDLLSQTAQSLDSHAATSVIRMTLKQGCIGSDDRDASLLRRTR